MTRLLFIVFLLLGFALPLRAETDFRAINAALANDVIVPAYNRLERATALQKNRWIEACEEPSRDVVDELRSVFHKTADVWAEVFHWTVGPVSQNLRRDRFYHWPVRRNAISRELQSLLANPAPDKLFPPVFARTSVAIQGLPALERILFSDIDPVGNPWACEIGRSIAINLATMAASIADEWRGDVVYHLSNGMPLPIHFGEPRAALNRFFTSLLTAFIIIKDQKILPALRLKRINANPKQLELWRSQRPRHTLILNLEVLAKIIKVFSTALENQHANRLAEGIARIQSLAQNLGPLTSGVTLESERRKIFAFVTEITQLQNDVASTLGDELGLTVGFNSLDGD